MDPKNVLPELRIIRHLIRERLEQCAGGPDMPMGDSRPRLSTATGTGLQPQALIRDAPAAPHDRQSRNEGDTAKDGPAEGPPASRGAGQGGDEHKED